MVKLFYATTINISVDPAHHEIFHAKDGKGGIKHVDLDNIQSIDRMHQS